MKRKNLLSGLLAGALVLTSVVVPGTGKEVKAEDYDLNEGLVASFSFDGEDLTDGQGGADASAVVTGLGAYSADPEYVDGHEGKGIQLGDYGLKLNRANLGEDFTVSLWMKPDGAPADNQSGVFLGYHNPEKWLSVAGQDGRYKFWANGNGYGWNELGRTDIGAGEWYQVTITGTSSTVALYVDGEMKASGNSNAPLAGDNQDIYIGVTNWDPEFTGAVDEVKVYNRTLSEGEVYRLYDAVTPAEDILDEEGITATESMNMVIGRTQKIEVSMPVIVADSNPTVTYESEDEDVATVSDDGTVEAAGEGKTTVTTTVKLGDVTKTATTAVTVTGSLEDTLVASFDFNGNLNNGVNGQAAASALVTGLNAYSGNVAYGEGRDGGQDQAVRLGDYGLKLNKQNLGTEYTVSLWVKSDDALAGNQVVLLLGHHSPENWIAISGNQNNTNKVKFWGNGGVFGTHTTLATSTIPSGEWHQITITGTKGSTTLYVDGIGMGQDTSNDPLNGTNADIYLGVNYWDPEFEGLVDDVKVYNIAMSAEEVQDQARETFQAAFEDMVDRTLIMHPLLGENSSSAQIIYDLELPDVLTEGTTIEWSSSNSDVIAADGSVTSPAETKEVTLTATVINGTLTTEKEFKFTVPALDKSELEALIAEAEDIDTTYLTDVSRERLETAITNAENAENSYVAVEKAAADLQLAMDNLEYKDEAVNPFAHIADPKTQTSLEAGATEKLFEIPENIQPYVDVEYSTEDADVVTYADGTITAVGAGKAIVTATVTAKYDGFKMEYSTAVEVTGSSTPSAGTVEDTTDPENNFGNAEFAGDSSALADAVLNEQDKEAVAAGADAQISLIVSDIADSVSDADKALVEAIKGDAEVGVYFDAALFKQIGDGQAAEVENIDGTVTIRMTVPESLRNTDTSVDRTYQLVRVFDGEGSLLPCSYDETTGTLTFTTNTFGTYALVYSDEAVEDPGTDPGEDPGEDPGTDPGTEDPDGDDGQKGDEGQNGNGQNGSSQNTDKNAGGTTEKAAQTGDTTNVLPLAAACVLAFTAAGTIVAVKAKRRK